jgi:hypothetical protein
MVLGFSGPSRAPVPVGGDGGAMAARVNCASLGAPGLPVPPAAGPLGTVLSLGRRRGPVAGFRSSSAPKTLS